MYMFLIHYWHYFQKPLVIAKNVTSSKQSISKIKETNKLREFKLCKAGNCTQDGKSDNTEFVSCIEEVVAPNKKVNFFSIKI